VGGGNTALLSNVMDELVSFRTKVRNYALVLPEATEAVQMEEGAVGAKGPKQEQKEKRRQLMQERKPLLEACDSLRGDLAAFGIHIKVEDCCSPCEIGHGLSGSTQLCPFTAPIAVPSPRTTAVAGGG